MVTRQAAAIAAAVSCCGQELEATVAMVHPTARLNDPSPKRQSVAFAAMVQLPNPLTEVLQSLLRQRVWGGAEDVFGLIRVAELLGQ